MWFRSILVFICCLSLSGCAVGPRGQGMPFGLLALGTGVAIGAVLTTLPRHHVVVDDRTYYSDGVFYRDSPHGYKVVAPRSGIWVDDIPKNHRVIRYKARDYFKAKGVWYRFDVQRKQYKVVDDPTDESWKDDD